MERPEAVDAIAEHAVMFRQHGGEPLEAVQLPQHVHGQYKSVTSNLSSPHGLVIKDGVQIRKQVTDLEGGGEPQTVVL